MYVMFSETKRRQRRLVSIYNCLVMAMAMAMFWIIYDALVKKVAIDMVAFEKFLFLSILNFIFYLIIWT